ncbi:MAG TPA: hypothetical protein VFO77_07150, partial [Actinoplanes sp.]|nr:hypothetical protein [Actinoplanes sp.]
MLRGRRGLQASAAPARELGRLVAAGVGLGAVVVIVAALAVGSPDRIVTLVRDNATRMSALDAVSVVRFYGGVGALVALSLGVVAGLLASDRVLLDARRRLWAQSVHRTMGVLTVGFLATHLVTEVAAQRVGPVAAAVPLFTGSPYLSLGPIAGYLITIAMWTGLIRARFAGRGRPGLWRVLHAAGYLAWPVALVHGLRAGRPAADWVVASYLLLLVVVAVVLGLRVSGERRHRRPCVGAPVAGLGAGLRTAGITGAGPAAVGPAAAGPAAEGLSGVGFAAPAQRSGHPDPMRQDPMHPGPMRPVSARPVSGPAARPVVGDRGAV